MDISHRTITVVNKRQESIKKWHQSDTAKARMKMDLSEFKITFENGSMLLAAVSSHDIEETKRLIHIGADVNFANVDGLTALHQACIDENLEMVKILLVNNADINARDNECWTPLHAAASTTNLEVNKYLVEHGADLAAANTEGELPLDLADDDDIIEYLTEQTNSKKINLDEARTFEHRMMLADVNKWIDKKIDASTVLDPQGATPLHVAAAKGYMDILKLLIEKTDIDINCPDSDGWTALHAAVYWKQEKAIEYLLASKANPYAKTFIGLLPVDLAEGSTQLFYKTQLRKLIASNKTIQDENKPITATTASPVSYPHIFKKPLASSIKSNLLVSEKNTDDKNIGLPTIRPSTGNTHPASTPTSNKSSVSTPTSVTPPLPNSISITPPLLPTTTSTILPKNYSKTITSFDMPPLPDLTTKRSSADSTTNDTNSLNKDSNDSASQKSSARPPLPSTRLDTNSILPPTSTTSTSSSRVTSGSILPPTSSRVDSGSILPPTSTASTSSSRVTSGSILPPASSSSRVTSGSILPPASTSSSRVTSGSILPPTSSASSSSRVTSGPILPPTSANSSTRATTNNLMKPPILPSTVGSKNASASSVGSKNSPILPPTNSTKNNPSHVKTSHHSRNRDDDGDASKQVEQASNVLNRLKLDRTHDQQAITDSVSQKVGNNTSKAYRDTLSLRHKTRNSSSTDFSDSSSLPLKPSNNTSTDFSDSSSLPHKTNNYTLRSIKDSPSLPPKTRNSSSTASSDSSSLPLKPSNNTSKAITGSISIRPGNNTATAFSDSSSLPLKPSNNTSKAMTGSISIRAANNTATALQRAGNHSATAGSISQKMGNSGSTSQSKVKEICNMYKNRVTESSTRTNGQSNKDSIHKHNSHDTYLTTNSYLRNTRESYKKMSSSTESVNQKHYSDSKVADLVSASDEHHSQQNWSVTLLKEELARANDKIRDLTSRLKQMTADYEKLKNKDSLSSNPRTSDDQTQLIEKLTKENKRLQNENTTLIKTMTQIGKATNSLKR